MSIGELLESRELFEEVGHSDRLVLEEAKEVLSEIPITKAIEGDTIEKAWFKKNLKVQEELIDFRTRLMYFERKITNELRVTQGEELDTEAYTYVKSKEEREALMIMNSPTFKDRKMTTEKLECLHLHVESLLQSLRASMRLFNK